MAIKKSGFFFAGQFLQGYEGKARLFGSSLIFPSRSSELEETAISMGVLYEVCSKALSSSSFWTSLLYVCYFHSLLQPSLA